MSETRAILEETCAKLFAKFEAPAVLRRVEETGDCTEVWAAVAEQGLDQIFSGGSDDPWRDACVVLKACGRHVLPAPLAETLMAGAVLADAGMEPMEGPLAFAEMRACSVSPAAIAEVQAAAPVATGNRLLDNIMGKVREQRPDLLAQPDVTLRDVPWGRAAQHIVTASSHEILVYRRKDAQVSPCQNVAREPRDVLDFATTEPVSIGRFGGPLPLVIGALMRAAQMAGCIEAVLAMTVQYARERQQFGKPIGSFQAIQHQLAILAGHAAAASRIVDAAFDRVAAGADIGTEAAFAKIRCGEAAGVAASIAHQTHGAIGFTDEHRLHYFTRRLWSWRSEFGSEAHWSAILGRQVAAAGADAYWPMVTAAG